MHGVCLQHPVQAPLSQTHRMKLVSVHLVFSSYYNTGGAGDHEILLCDAY